MLEVKVHIQDDVQEKWTVQADKFRLSFTGKRVATASTMKLIKWEGTPRYHERQSGREGSRRGRWVINICRWEKSDNSHHTFWSDHLGQRKGISQAASSTAAAALQYTSGSVIWGEWLILWRIGYWFNKFFIQFDWDWYWKSVWERVKKYPTIRPDFLIGKRETETPE